MSFYILWVVAKNVTYQQETHFIHQGAEPDPTTGSTQPPIYQTASFAYDDPQQLEDVFNGKAFGYYYSRVTNPTTDALEKRLAGIENGLGAAVVSSGMAAISTTILSLASSGDTIVVGKSLFGSTYYLFEGLITDCGINVKFVDSTNLAEFKEAINEKTALLFVEAIGNPKLDIPDLKALSLLANQHNIPLVVDTTFATPVLLDAKSHGVHIVVYATTKYIAGSGTTVGGAVIDTGVMNWKTYQRKKIQESYKQYGQFAFLAALKKIRSNAGSNQSPFNAYLTSLGIDTLALRVKQQATNATKLAIFFEKQAAINHINYPGLNTHKQHLLAGEQFKSLFGSMITIRLGTKERAFRVLKELKLVHNLVNLGDAKTVAVYPATTIYRNITESQQEEAGVYPDLIRISVGLEHSDDLIADFKQALEAVS